MIRKIHLDFHSHPSTQNIGVNFNPVEFADILASAHVNSLATPGKCQYGATYFDTAIGHAHPNLVRPELFPATVAACAERGIRVQAYYSLGLDDFIADKRPEWRQRYRDGTYAAWDTKHICFASPYVDEIVIPELLETMERCPGIVGFWFDICLYCSGAFYSGYFDRVARDRLGHDADDERRRWSLAREIVRDCCQRIDKAIRDRMPHAENYYNSLALPGEAYNIALQPVQEVENPFTFGGPELLTAQARWLRRHGKPVIGLVSRFMGPWMDPGTVRTKDQLRLDVGRAIALGCGISLGDHRHPDGTIDPEVYSRIEPAYRYVETSEDWLDGASACREAILLTDVERGAPHLFPVLPPKTLHAARLLEEIGVQFDVATFDDELPDAKLIISPRVSPNIPVGCSVLLVGCGADPSSPCEGTGIDAAQVDGGYVVQEPYAFFRCNPDLGVGSFAHDIRLPYVTVNQGGEILAEELRSASSKPSFAGPTVIGPLVTQQGAVIRCGIDLFAEHQESGSPFFREVLRALCDRLLGRRLVRHDAGTSVAAHLHRLSNGYTLHLLHWAIERSGKHMNPAAEFPKLGPIKVELAIADLVVDVALVPNGTSITFEQTDGYCRFTVPGMHVWQIVGITTGRNLSN